jgi:hypothetical protein
MVGLENKTKAWFLAAILALAPGLAACGKSVPARGAEGSGGAGAMAADRAGSSDQGASPGSTKGAKMSSTDQDVAVVQAAIGKELNLAPADVRVRALEVTVPGITVFVASVHPSKAGRGVTRTGIVENGAVYTETEAMSRVARAWGYGPKRAVPAVDVAQVFGALHSAMAESSPFIDDDTVQTYKKVSGPKRAAAVAMPVESTVDGNPAVVYCLTSSSRAIPFSVVTAIVKPGPKVEIRAQPVNED